jgi:effector-binding domain-containing protein
MNRARLFRLAVTLVPAAAISLALSAGFAQTPPAAPAATPAAPAAPAAAPPATPPATTPPVVAAPATTPAPAAKAPPPAEQKVQVADPFGEDTTLTAKMVVALKGSGEWDSAFETLTDSLRTLTTFLDKQGIKPAGLPMIVYTSTDDNGFGFIAEIPIEQEPKSLPKTITVGKSPDGKVLKFVHRGSYDNMDNTYEAITNHLDDKKLEAKDTFIEEYVTDPLKTPEDKLVINVFVPLK